MERKLFRNNQSPTVADIARLVNGDVLGDPQKKIYGLADIQAAQAGDITFLANPKYTPYMASTLAGAILVGRSYDVAPHQTCIKTDDPSWAFALVAQTYLFIPPTLVKGIHPTAVLGQNVVVANDVCVGPGVVVGDHVQLGRGVVLGANVVVGPYAVIGADTYIHPLVMIGERCIVGERVIIHSGTVVGSDGFGYAFVKNHYKKIPHLGIVRIGNDVEIGANVSIDRARFDETVIGYGVKIDNQVQIAHNVIVGDHSLVIAQSGIAGSTHIGKYVTIAAQVGVAGHIHVGDRAVLAGRSGVTKDVPENVTYSGFPAIDHKKEKKNMVLRNQLPDLWQRVRDLEEKIAVLELQNTDKKGKTC